MFAAFREFACFAICKKSIRRQHSGNSILLGRRILLSNTGENIYERRDGRWEGRYICGRKPDGRAQYVSVYGRSCSDVRNKIRERLRACTPDAVPRSTGTSVLTVNQLFESFLDHADVKPSTYARYKTVIDLHILPKLGKRRVAGLTAKELSGYLARSEDAETCAPAARSLKRVYGIWPYCLKVRSALRRKSYTFTRML